MQENVSFDITAAERDLIVRIVKRAAELDAKHSDGDLDQLSLEMDLAAAHANGCRLDLKRQLAADEFTFTHDVLGIRRHIDRNTGRIMDCFLPRCRNRRAA